MTAQTSKVHAAPPPRALRGCKSGTTRPEVTGGKKRLAPDPTQEQRASGMAACCRTLAAAEVAPPAQVRRRGSRRGAARRSCLVADWGTRQARGQRAAWCRKRWKASVHVRNGRCRSERRTRTTLTPQSTHHAEHLQAFQPVSTRGRDQASRWTARDAALPRRRTGRHAAFDDAVLAPCK